MKAEDIMVRKVITITPGSTVKEAAKKMAEHRVGSLVVVEENRVVGIVTDMDILVKVTAEGNSPSRVKVKDVMSKNIIFADPEADIFDIAETMTKYRIKKIPIIKNGLLVGIVTATDVVASEPKMLKHLSDIMLLSSKKKPLAG